MLNFKIKKLDNVKFSYDELVQYFNTVQEKYQHIKWTPDESIRAEALTQGHTIEDLYSWSVQSKMLDPTTPCPPYNIPVPNSKDVFDIPTAIYFGFGKKVVDAFPCVLQTGIAVHPPGSKLQLHIDTETYIKIHFPIITNPGALFYYEDESFHMEAGSAYLVNTTLPHGVLNNGTEPRSHLICKIKTSDAQEILDSEWIFDPNMLDFDVLELPNVTFSPNELTEYYQQVESQYSHLKWTLPARDPAVDPSKFPNEYDRSVGIWGYGIQSNLKDATLPAPPYNVKSAIPSSEKIPYATNKTVLAFGFAEKILAAFPKVEELVITGHPAGSAIGQHTDKDINIRIHLPIITNDDSYFIFGDKRYLLKSGKAYIINTNKPHGTENTGTTDRVHLFFKIPIGRVAEVIRRGYNI